MGLKGYEEIKPCPYCGSEAEPYEIDDGCKPYIAAIYCLECPLEVEDPTIGYSELLKVWNNLPRNITELHNYEDR